MLLDYLGAVQARTTEMLQGLVPNDLDRIADRRWDPPVTVGVRLVSVADDCCSTSDRRPMCGGCSAAERQRGSQLVGGVGQRTYST